MWKYILTTFLLVIIAVIITVIIRRRKGAAAARLKAAAVLLREWQLDNAISRDANAEYTRIRPVLELTWKDTRKRDFLFDPSVPIRVGKDPVRNNICIRRETVGAEHCVLMMYRGALTVQDLNSRNGTFIKRGRKRYRIRGRVFVRNGDRLEVGGVSMQINLFMFDSAYV